MKTSPNGQVQIPDEDYYIWEAYGFQCLMCQGWASCLHESPPKSLNPDWKAYPMDRYPVCDFHHNVLHQTMGWREGKRLLDDLRLKLFPDYVERIENGYKAGN